MLQFLLLALTLYSPDASDDFRSIHSFRCEFVGGAGHKFGAGGLEEHARTLDKRPDLFEETHGLVFDAIDYRTLRARSLAKTGTETVTVIAGDRQVSFLQVGASGNVVLTTIIRVPRPADGGSSGTYHAVRSYHVLRSIEGTEASQLTGVCMAR